MNQLKTRRKRGGIVRLSIGWILTIGGIILWLVPIVPGFFLLFPGIAILAAESRWIRRLLRRYREHRLMKRALREAERVGVKIDLDDAGDGTEEDDAGGAPPGSVTGNAR